MALTGLVDWFTTSTTNVMAGMNRLMLQPNINEPAIPLRNILNIDINPNDNPNEAMSVRDHLFHSIFLRVSLLYARIFPWKMRVALEFFLLLKAVLFFFALIYVHVLFIKNPSPCLQNIKDWPRDGVLRIEIIPDLEKHIETLADNESVELTMSQINKDFFFGIGPRSYRQYYNKKYATNDTYTYYWNMTQEYNTHWNLRNAAKKANIIPGEQYIVEYALEYGHLRLSSETRYRLNIPVMVIQLDPTNRCFGHSLNKFLLREFLGYDDMLMASIRTLAEQENNKGYLRNVITSEHYRFVSTWWTAWSSYPTALFVMLLFTFATSMLLRFSHHQIFIFIVDLLHMLEFNVVAQFPIAPLVIVVLALVGMEAIMSEFFNDTTTAFYTILMVWFADQYYSICCRTDVSKRHWVRFFYLFHFAFYAYHHRFNGQNRSLALVVSWLFIQYSMLYFFHRYELPLILSRRHVIRTFEINVTRAAGADGSNMLNDAFAEGNGNDGADDARNNAGNNAGNANDDVNGNDNHRRAEQERRDPFPIREVRHFADNNMRIITWYPHLQQTRRRLRIIDQRQWEQPNPVNLTQQLQQQQQQFVRNPQIFGVRHLLRRSFNTLRRELFGDVPLRIRIQQTDLQQINLGGIQIVPDQISRGVSTSNLNVNENTNETVTTATATEIATVTTTATQTIHSDQSLPIVLPSTASLNGEIVEEVNAEMEGGADEQVEEQGQGDFIRNSIDSNNSDNTLLSSGAIDNHNDNDNNNDDDNYNKQNENETVHNNHNLLPEDNRNNIANNNIQEINAIPQTEAPTAAIGPEAELNIAVLQIGATETLNSIPECNVVSSLSSPLVTPLKSSSQSQLQDYDRLSGDTTSSPTANSNDTVATSTTQTQLGDTTFTPPNHT